MTEMDSSQKRFWLPALMFILLAYFNSVGAVAVALMMEGNPKVKGALAVGFSNFASYVLVAVSGNTAGMILDRFTSSPEYGWTHGLSRDSLCSHLCAADCVYASGIFLCKQTPGKIICRENSYIIKARI